MFGNQNNSPFGSTGGFGQQNTAPAFGAPAAAPQGGGMFGQAPAPFGQAPAPAFGGTTFGAPAPAGGGLFGAPAPAPSGGLFGAPAPAPAFGGGGVFGAPAPAAGGGLFGAPAPAPAFGSPAPAGGGLFGAPAPAPTSMFGAPAPGGFGQAPAPFGGAPAPGTFGAPAGGGLFGAPAPAPTGGLFGSTPAPAPFGAAPAPAFGSTFGAPAPAPFGSTAPAGGGLFGAPAPAPGGGLFGAPAPGAAAPSGGGTRGTPFQVTPKTDGSSTINFQSISAMPVYEQKSFEELRMEDYMQGNRGQANTTPMAGNTGGFFGAAPAPSGGLFGSTPAPAPSGGLFGSTPAPAPFGAAPSGGLFGSPAPAPAFGSFGSNPAPAPFGAPAPAPFGSQAPAPFGAPAPAGGGLFGQPAPAPAFGAPAGGGLFGQPAPAPAFGAAPSVGLFGQPAPAPAFGAAPSGGLFGQPAPAPAFGAAPSGGLFGQPAPAPAFGAPPPGGLFGGAPAPAFGTPSPGMFGQPPAQSGFFGGTQPGLAQPQGMPAGGGAVLPPNSQIIPPAMDQMLQHRLTTLEKLRDEFEKNRAWQPDNSQQTTTSSLSAQAAGFSSPPPPYAISSASSMLASSSSPPSAAQLRPRGFPRRNGSTDTPTAKLSDLGRGSGDPNLRSPVMQLVVKPNSLNRPRLRLKAAQADPITSPPKDPADSPAPHGSSLSPLATNHANTPTPQSMAPPQEGAVPKPSDAAEALYHQATADEPAPDPPATPEAPATPSGSKLAPKLTMAGYETSPSIEELASMSEADLAAVENFAVRRPGIGEVAWEGAVDVRGVDLDQVVSIEIKDVSVYNKEEQQGTKPLVGTKLNRPAVITYEEVYPRDDPQASKEEMDKFASRLEKRCEKMGAEFVDYARSTGTWKIRASHF